MNVTLAGIEELELFPDEASRQQAIREHAESVSGWSLALGISLMAVVGLGTFVATRFIVVPAISKLLPSGLPPWSREPLQFAIIAVVMFVCVRALHRWGVRREMRKKLVRLGVPVCMGCGYLLKGLPAPPSTTVCPECGRTIDEPVQIAMKMSASMRSGAGGLAASTATDFQPE